MIYFAWDPVKAESNLRKHGVRFEAATEVFEDAFTLSELDPIADEEQRWKTIGLGGRALLVVVYTIVVVGEDEYIRIITARRAERKEIRRYEKQKLH